MSASLVYRNTMNSSGLDEQNAYRLAMELSILGLNSQGAPVPSSMEDDHLHHDGSEFGSQDINFANKISQPIMEDPLAFQNGARKSANMTETVPVPSSEHVAEIVGRQGCKIKALRAKTNTYIKTPVRGALPVFVVTGRKEDVAQAKQQILSAADHFSQIRASRRTAGSQPSNNGTCSPTSTPGHITIQVRVPYKVVGLVVGPKGATIKRIQQTTSTYIVTPGRDKDPVFEVTGLPDNVEKAREEIEKHIASRTGTDNNSDLQIDDFNINGIDSGFHEQSNDPSSNSTFTSYGNNVFNIQDNLTSISSLSGQMTTFPGHGQPLKSAQTQMCNTHTGAAMKISSDYIMPSLTNFNSFNRVNSDSFEVDEGIGASGGSIFDPTAIWSDASSFGLQRSNSISASSRILPPGEDGPHPRTRRTNSDPLAAAFQRIDATFNSSSPTSSQGSTSPVTGRRNTSPARGPRGCVQCGDDITAALVPCGHNSFCFNCANKICHRPKESRLCPICLEVPSQAILIRN